MSYLKSGVIASSRFDLVNDLPWLFYTDMDHGVVLESNPTYVDTVTPRKGNLGVFSSSGTTNVYYESFRNGRQANTVDSGTLIAPNGSLGSISQSYTTVNVGRFPNNVGQSFAMPFCPNIASAYSWYINWATGYFGDASTNYGLLSQVSSLGSTDYIAICTVNGSSSNLRLYPHAKTALNVNVTGAWYTAASGTSGWAWGSNYSGGTAYPWLSRQAALGVLAGTQTTQAIDLIYNYLSKYYDIVAT